jgi:hypothetical protein
MCTAFVTPHKTFFLVGGGGVGVIFNVYTAGYLTMVQVVLWSQILLVE